MTELLMPLLTWPSKNLPDAFPAAVLNTESVIYPAGRGLSDGMPQNRLIWGDNLSVMAALLPEFEGKIDLIYVDPPFFTNRRYPARIGRGEDSRKPKDWQLTEGYPDHWEDLDAYLDMLYPRLALMHRLLSPTGTLYLHLDWHADAYARLLLDEIFGPEQLLNEIIWVYHGPSPIRSAFNRKHDTILSYTKGKSYTFNVDAVRQPYDPSTIKTFEASSKAGFGKIPDLERGKVPEDWWYFPVVARLHSERTGYPTQKPAALLERIILASSNPGDLVADFFCGSGTTPAAAQRLGRRFLASDGAWRAVHTTRARLVAQGGGPFALWTDTNLGDARQLSDQVGAAREVALAYRVDGDLIEIVGDDVETLDYWEVDPAWNGGVFHSVAQALRPRRQPLVTTAIRLPEKCIAGNLTIRGVTVEGEVIDIPHGL